MLKQFVFPLALLLAVATAGADQIPYDKIPSDATGFFYWNMDGFLASRLVAEAGLPNGFVEHFKSTIGGPFQSITVFSVGQGTGINGVGLLHIALGTDARKRLDDILNQGKDAVVINYGSQEVHYSTATVQEMLEACAKALTGASKEKPPAESGQLHATPDKPIVPKRSHLNIGLDTAGNNVSWESGHPYIAFVGSDQIVITTDLTAMTATLDVLNGKKPSLAKEDPKGLKSDVPPGTIMAGAGLTAELDGDNSRDANHPDAKPANVNAPGPAGFGLDLFGSFKGKAVLARLDAGEAADSEFIDAAFTMVDADTAEQFKNLSLGVKALLSMSKAEIRPMIDPLEVNSDGKVVTLHWSYATAKLVDLIRQQRGESNVPNGKMPGDATHPSAY